MTDQPRPRVTAPDGSDPTLGSLLHDLSAQIPELIRSEMRLAQAEVAQKGRSAGLGIGLFSVAGVLALLALGTLVATAVIGLDAVLPLWASGLLVAAVLLVGAAVAGLVGRSNVADASPVAPQRALDGLKEDIATVKGQHQ